MSVVDEIITIKTPPTREDSEVKGRLMFFVETNQC